MTKKLQKQNKQMRITLWALWGFCCFMLVFQIILAINLSESRSLNNLDKVEHIKQLDLKNDKINKLKDTIESMEKEIETLSDMRCVSGVVSEY